MKRPGLTTVALLSGTRHSAKWRAQCPSWPLETGQPARGGVPTAFSAKANNSSNWPASHRSNRLPMP
eukprot:9283783-Lingulodinium_polyedra.AAC.1